MFGSQTYSEGQFQPKRGGAYNWHVWCNAGALQVLDSEEYVPWLTANPIKSYLIAFANGSAARIRPGDQLWQKLMDIAQNYTVEVFPLNWDGEYCTWTGDEKSLHAFDALSIKAKIVK